MVNAERDVCQTHATGSNPAPDKHGTSRNLEGWTHSPPNFELSAIDPPGFLGYHKNKELMKEPVYNAVILQESLRDRY